MKLLELFDILDNTINEDADEVTFWTKYVGHRDFPDESSARNFIARKANLGHAWTMGIDDPVEHYSELAQRMPVYQTKKGWRIGTPQVLKRLQAQRSRKNRFTWDSVDLLDIDWIALFSSGLVNRFDVDHIDGPKLVSMRKINGTETTNREHSEKIAQQIKEMYKFRPIVLDDNFTIVDGHHRFEAAQIMKMKDIPAYVVYTQEFVNEEEIDLPVLKTGDELMVGKFKNRNATIKGFTKDKHNQPIAKTDKGDQQIFKGRVKKLMTSEARNPKVRVKKGKDDVYYAYIGSNRVGVAQVYSYRDDKVGENERYIWKSAVHDNFKRQGIATELYNVIADDLAKEGLKLVPSPGTQLSDEAYEFWKARDPESVAKHGKFKAEPYQKYIGKTVEYEGRPAVVRYVGWSSDANEPAVGIRYTDVPEGSANSQTHVRLSSVGGLIEAKVSKGKAIRVNESAQYPREMTADEIENYVRSIHDDEDDFNDGDLLERIHSFSKYTLMTLQTESIPHGQWSISDDLAEEYAQRILRGEEMPPIVIQESGMVIIDGTHRHQAALLAKQPMILAYVGLKRDAVPDDLNPYSSLYGDYDVGEPQ